MTISTGESMKLTDMGALGRAVYELASESPGIDAYNAYGSYSRNIAEPERLHVSECGIPPLENLVLAYFEEDTENYSSYDNAVITGEQGNMSCACGKISFDMVHITNNPYFLLEDMLLKTPEYFKDEEVS